MQDSRRLKNHIRMMMKLLGMMMMMSNVFFDVLVCACSVSVLYILAS